MAQLPIGWETTSSEYLHKQDWLTVRRDSVKLPSGHVIEDYFVLEYPDWINTIAITKDGNFVLVKQFRYGLGVTAFELCAGVVDGNELPLKAAQRELLEETGYGGGNWLEWMVIAPNPATSTNWVHCFLATDVELIQLATPEPGEDLSAHLFSFEEVRKLMLNRGIIQALHLAPLWKYVAQQGIDSSDSD